VNVLQIASGDLWAGAEAVIYQLIKGLRRMDNCAITAVFLNNGKLARDVQSLGVNVFILDERTRSFASLLKNFRQIVRTIRPEIIHSHRYKENLLSYLASRGFQGRQLISTQHGMPENTQVRRSFKFRMICSLNFKLLSRYFHSVVAVSEEMKTSMVVNHGFDQKKITVIYNGIAVPPSTIRPHHGRLVIGSAGRLFPVKDYDLLVDIAAKAEKKCDTVDFLLAGEGPMKEKLIEKIGQLGLEKRFTLLGHVDDMASFYQKLDLYINTSVHEGIPMSVLEAMSHGLPVIAPRVGGFPEIVTDSFQGFLVSNRDPEVFADKCILLSNDVLLRSRMSSAARQRIVQSFSSEAMCDGYYSLYEKILSARA
jgi:glycosyltransferase involved in cell wall biosynthesis